MSFFYKKKIASIPYPYPLSWVALCQVCNIMTVIGLFHVVRLKYNLAIFVCLSVACIIITFVINCFLLTERKYKNLTEKHKDEKHKTIKGWGVFLYVIGSVFLYVFTMAQQIR